MFGLVDKLSAVFQLFIILLAQAQLSCDPNFYSHRSFKPNSRKAELDLESSCMRIASNVIFASYHAFNVLAPFSTVGSVSNLLSFLSVKITLISRLTVKLLAILY